MYLVLDEVGAIVIDIGSSSFRGGYAGEDMPKVAILVISIFICNLLLIAQGLVGFS